MQNLNPGLQPNADKHLVIQLISTSFMLPFALTDSLTLVEKKERKRKKKVYTLISMQLFLG